MAEYIFLMHDDAVADENAWWPCLHTLQQGGFFEGGSVIGEGICVRKNGAAGPITGHIAGFIRVNADGIDQARSLLVGNRVFEAGGTVEIRELPRTD